MIFTAVHDESFRTDEEVETLHALAVRLGFVSDILYWAKEMARREFQKKVRNA